MKKILAMVLVVFTLFGLTSCGSSEKLEWPDDKLGILIPRIDDAKGEIVSRSLETLHINLDGISENQYLDYIIACKTKGFNIEVKENGTVYYNFTAFNSNGYKIDIDYYLDGDMDISVYAPIPMTNFIWPDSDIAKLLPEPDSDYGKIEWEAEYGFVIYVGNTTRAQYNDYVNEAYSLGFTVDYKKGEDFFYADNEDGYRVSLKYEGFNIMFIRIDEPKENEGSDNNDGNTENNSTSSGELINGMRPEFKDAMDSYERFFNEYCDFMKEYNSSNDPTSLLSDYISFMSHYNEAMAKLDEISNDELNTAELIYYTEVMARINQKLLEIY